MQICLFDTPLRENLFPFTHTRSIADIRCGILTLRERWEHYFGVQHTDTLTVSYLQNNYPSSFYPCPAVCLPHQRPTVHMQMLPTRLFRRSKRRSPKTPRRRDSARSHRGTLIPCLVVIL
ncbi:MAG: hypothetical protein EBU79_12980 [Betaproteobacteria bacterium]|nr:hypothetical protein [Betaproteobacteria bacterium]